MSYNINKSFDKFLDALEFIKGIDDLKVYRKNGDVLNLSDYVSSIQAVIPATDTNVGREPATSTSLYRKEC